MPSGRTVSSWGVHGIFAPGFGPDSNLCGNTAINNCELRCNPANGAYTTYPDTLGGREIFHYLAHGISVQ